MSMASEQNKWQAENDARTLVESQRILADKQRANAAKRVASEQAKALQKVAGKKVMKKK